MTWWTDPVQGVCDESRREAALHQGCLTKPAGSLGRLEEIAIRLAGLQRTNRPAIQQLQIRVFAGDHGVTAEGVSAFPQSVTREMIANFARGGAAINVLARRLNADFSVVNVGTATPMEDLPKVLQVQVAPGTDNMCLRAAMTDSVCAEALATGRNQVLSGSDLFIGGEMGIGNTTAAAAVVSQLLDVDPSQTVGPGTGIDDDGLERKRHAVVRALALHGDQCTTPFATLASLGGLEIAALTGAFLAAAQRGIPVLVDGYICSAAALLACRFNAGVANWLLFSHHSAEPGHALVLEALSAEPLLDLGMRLGEGSGAAAAVPLIQAACELHNEMATFEQAGVSTADSSETA
ncbi:MAG: nicotinate-nucleotide--dimethylbenzimidazole phosphoribosyltransferase [Pseudomonadota bacterium]